MGGIDQETPAAASTGKARRGTTGERVHVCDGRSELVVQWPDGAVWLLFDGNRPKTRLALRKAHNQRVRRHLAHGGGLVAWRFGREGEPVVDPRGTPRKDS